MRRSRFGARFPGFALRPTRAFWLFLVAAPVLGLAALNTGNNALYLLLSLVLGVFVATGTLSRHTLSRLAVETRPVAEVFAGSPVFIEAIVRNGSAWLPACGVVCRFASGGGGPVVVPTVPAGGKRSVSLPARFPRRGRRMLPAVQVEVRLPIPFFVKSVRVPSTHEVLVYPRRFPAGIPRLSSAPWRERRTTSGRGLRGAEVEQLREFHAGDDRRDIHWKQTARQQRLIVMERRERAVPSSFLVLDRQLPRRDDADLAERFEDLISEVASVALARLRRGEAIGLVLGSRVTQPETGPNHARVLLEQLALVEAVGPGEDPLPPQLGAAPAYRLVERR